jgi:ATP-dependent helicase HrpA/adenine-specific DNA-methyltransferase
MPNTGLARARRKKPTWAEKLVRRWLRDRRFTGYKFRREHPAGEYLLDFFCAEARLSIELDGFQHGHPARQAYDTERARFLETLGIKELRFWNWRLRREGQAVRDAIFNALQQRAPHPLPAYTRLGIVGAEKSQGEARPQDVMDPGKSQMHARPHPGPLPRGEGELPCGA